MEKRIKAVRDDKGMTQAQFADALGMGQSTLTMIETGKRSILDRHIKTICSVFGVSEDWLRTGEGEMYMKADDNLVDQVAKAHGLDAAGRVLLETVLELPDGYAAVLLDAARRLVAQADAESAPDEIDIDAEVDAYRQELIREKRAAVASGRLRDTGAAKD